MAQAKTKTKEQDDVIELNLQNLLTPIAITLGSLLIAAALLIGLLSISSNLDGTSSNDNNAAADNNDDTADDTGDDVDPENANTSIDDDPYLGDKDKAKVAIVEFSDFECPFCKRFHQETFDQLKEEYVDTGKAIFVYRDLPLSFHDPMATKLAIAAECVQEYGDNQKYFDFAQKVYNTTASNGEGMSDDTLYSLAADAGVDKGKVKSCVEDNKFKDEVQSDASDASASGVSGTPGFIVGILEDDGSVTGGTLIAGAQPYDTFKQAIEAKL